MLAHSGRTPTRSSALPCVIRSLSAGLNGSTAVGRMTVADRDRMAAAMREFNAAVMQVEEESLLVELIT